MQTMVVDPIKEVEISMSHVSDLNQQKPRNHHKPIYPIKRRELIYLKRDQIPGKELSFQQTNENNFLSFQYGILFSWRTVRKSSGAEV
jgi:hypothetical protein